MKHIAFTTLEKIANVLVNRTTTTCNQYITLNDWLITISSQTKV